MRTTIAIKPSTLTAFKKWKHMVKSLNPENKLSNDALLMPLIKEGYNQAKKEMQRRFKNE